VAQVRDPESVTATTQAAQFSFLLSELQTGLTFAKIALNLL